MRLFLNKDCMEGMKEYPDNYFDLAIVDPVYGDVTQGGYSKNTSSVLAENKEYHISLWEQSKTSDDYFRELQRVTKNQIVWGGQLLRKQLSNITRLDSVG